MATLTDMVMDMAIMDMERGKPRPLLLLKLMLPPVTIIMDMDMDMVDMVMDMDMERGRLMLPLVSSWLWTLLWWIRWIRPLWIWKEGGQPRILSSWIWWIWSWIWSWLWILWLSSIYLLVSQKFVAFIGICWNLLSRNTDLYLKKIKTHSLK